jgi:hypothetical protein
MKRCSVATIVAFGGMFLATAMSVTAMSLKQELVGLKSLEHAWTTISIQPRSALKVFQAQLPEWAGVSTHSVGYIEADSGELVAAVLASDGAAAGGAWNRIKRESNRPTAVAVEPIGDVFAWQRRWKAAFSSYEHAGQFGSADCTATIRRGLSSAVQKRLQQAVAAWSLPANCSGPYDTTDVSLALKGLALAAQGEWPQAKSMWIQAAHKQRTVPDIDALYPGNLIALSMLYHFRR